MIRSSRSGPVRGWRRALWFVALYLGGVFAVALVALVFRFLIKSV